MKKLLLSISGAFLLFGANAQQVTNGSFENWGAQGASTSEPIMWSTYNADAAGAPAGVTEGTTGSYAGNSHAIITTMTGFGALGLPDTLPGIVAYQGDLLLNGVASGPYTDRPESYSFAYQASPVNNDTAAVIFQLSKWNSGTGSTDVVGYGVVTIANLVSSWTEVNIPITYQSSVTPDTLLLIATSSAGFFGVANAIPEPGSELLLDKMVICDQMHVAFTETANLLQVDFNDTTYATGIESVSWDFGDGNNSTSHDPSHTYSTDGTYSVSLTVTDSCGNDSTVTQQVTVSAVGIETGIRNSTISVYPNPSKDIFYLSLELGNATEITAGLFDMSGRKVMDVYNGTATVLNRSIDASSMDAGVYFLRITDDEGHYLQEKIVLTK